ncbi:hypothetical protein [Dactylosporangium sp. CA-233914]|uniref:hypothetical protein n=1 Tax=Dactylosporangium sp. CA-233914 TaxID=3239934 RepID=UPI003D90C788
MQPAFRDHLATASRTAATLHRRVRALDPDLPGVADLRTCAENADRALARAARFRPHPPWRDPAWFTVSVLTTWALGALVSMWVTLTLPLQILAALIVIILVGVPGVVSKLRAESGPGCDPADLEGTIPELLAAARRETAAAALAFLRQHPSPPTLPPAVRFRWAGSTHWQAALISHADITLLTTGVFLTRTPLTEEPDAPAASV